MGEKDGRKRKWEVYEGRSSIRCNGRCVTSDKGSVLYMTLVLIIVTSGLFFAFDCRFLATRVTPAIPAVGGVLFIFVLSTLLRTAFMDPGIIPRATKAEAEYIQSIIGDTETIQPNGLRNPPQTQTVLIDGQEFKLKYCFTCKIFRPPRASHCSVCDNCVERFDHHCPWVANCVGRRNYRYFFLFLFSCSLLCVFVFGCNVANIVLLAKETTFVDALKKSWPTAIEILVSFFSMWTVIGLLGYHVSITVQEITTNEDIKSMYSKKKDEDAKNPFDHGGYCANLCYILCGAQSPSLADFRGYVDPEAPPAPRGPAARRPLPSVKQPAQHSSGHPARHRPQSGERRTSSREHSGAELSSSGGRHSSGSTSRIQTAWPDQQQPQRNGVHISPAVPV